MRPEVGVVKDRRRVLASRRLPSFLKLLARLGVIFGALNAWLVVASIPYLFVDRDEVIQAYREQTEALTSPAPFASASPSPSPSSELFARVPGQDEAERYYQALGWMRPLAGITLILSVLLLFGCARALRGSRWGHSAWSTACALMLPLQAMNATLLRYKLGPLPAAAWFGCALGVGYSVVCLIYLRRPRIRALFDKS